MGDHAQAVTLAHEQAQAKSVSNRTLYKCAHICALAAAAVKEDPSLWERYADQARASRRDGGITVLVSHRFSTVRMADLIVVIGNGTIAEVGSHDELMARRGPYADLYTIQAAAYQ